MHLTEDGGCEGPQGRAAPCEAAQEHLDSSRGIQEREAVLSQTSDTPSVICISAEAHQACSDMFPSTGDSINTLHPWAAFQ